MKSLQDTLNLSTELDVIVTELETELYAQKFALYFPKLTYILTTRKGVPKGEVNELTGKFNSYFPHLSNLLGTAKG